MPSRLPPSCPFCPPLPPDPQPSFGLFSGAGGVPGVGQKDAVAAGGSGSHPVHNNELVIRIQEEESIYLKMMCKMPVSDAGGGMCLAAAVSA
jgi:hypothetical protein